MKKTLVLPELLVQEQICPSTGLGGIVQVTFHAPPEYNKILVIFRHPWPNYRMTALQTESVAVSFAVPF